MEGKYLPTDQPMLPQKIWLTIMAPVGKGTSKIPKFEVPKEDIR